MFDHLAQAVQKSIQLILFSLVNVSIILLVCCCSEKPSCFTFQNHINELENRIANFELD